MKNIWPLIKIITANVLLVVMPVRDLVAGNILSRTPAPSSPTTTPDGTTPSATPAAVLPSAQNRLGRTAKALQSVKDMQAAARALALQGANNLGADPNHPGTLLPNVPNGLGAGGLQVDSRVTLDPSLWTGASLPQQAVVGDQTKVTIVQNAPQALLNWASFNIGKQTTLTFDQSLGGAAKSSWIAFNKVNDPTAVPSQILGQIQAPGQVFVINANGIIFGGSAQINVNTLVASALPINDNLVSRGLLNNPDTQFLFSALPLAAGANGTPAFTPAPLSTPNGLPGDVVVQPGAQITAPTTPAHVGGRVFLFGANVKNEGIIATPDGQTILAAGLQVGLAAHPTTDPSLRGLDVFVGAVGDGGKVSNEGLIDVPRGNITLAGAAVEQRGFLDSSTSVALNGRIDLLANYNAVGSGGFQNLPAFLPTSTGVVTLGPDSVTQILPELASTERVIGTTLALQSQVNLQGQAIYFAPNALVLAPNANVALNAGIWKLTDPGTLQARDSFVHANGAGQIYLDSGAAIDVGGTEDVAVSVSENIVAVQLTAAALANSPLLRNGPLRGQTIYVDTGSTGTYNGRDWIGTPLADASGYANLIQRTVGELTIAGGTVKMDAGESVVLQAGSSINVSGGWINYQGGDVKVTRLSSAGKSFLTAQATPDRVYDSAVTTTEFQQGYIKGANGGGITITAPAMALDGHLVGNTVAGPRQQQQLPSPSRLSLVFQAQDISTPAFLAFSPTPPSIVFQASSDLQPADPFVLGAPLRADRKSDVSLSPSLIGQNGFGSFSIDNSDGSITVPASVELKSVVGGSINLAAANMDIEGSLVAPGGNLQLNVYDFSPYAISTLTTTPASDPTRGNFTLGPTGKLSVEGTMALDYSEDFAPVRIAGGSISIKSFSADLAEGSTIDASGGVTTSPTGKRTYGKGGSISISVGQDPNVAAIFGGQLTLGSSLEAYSGSKGGSLSIQASSIQVGGTTANSDTLLLSPEFFSTGGFSSFNLRGLEGLSIAPNTVIAPAAQSLLAVVDANGVASLEKILQPEGVRSPVSLTFAAIGIRDPFLSNPLVVRGDLVVGEGAVIQAGPQATVRLSGDTVAVLGSVLAAGGTITVAGGANSAALFLDQQQALPTVVLGDHSVLSAAGTTVLTPNAQGYRTGSVLAGGKITVSGNIVAESGAILDVSGASDVLDVAPGYLGTALLVQKPTSGAALVSTRIDSDGGSIVLAGSQELITEATLKGTAGGAKANGGNLTISSGRFYSPNIQNSAKTPLDTTLAVSQHGLDLLPGGIAVGQPVFDSDGQPIAGYGHFSADSFQAGGFDALTLRGTVQFSGPVSISANRLIAVGDGGVIFADSSVNLTAPYVVLGKPFQAPQQASQITTPYQDGENRPFLLSPTYGTGNLTVEATSLIDVGPLSLQNIGQAHLIASGGDIRGNGTLEIAGDLTLRAGQIYPPTATRFTIAAFDYTLNNSLQLGSVTIEASGNRQLPLSGGGALTIYASTINQDGVLRAPLGTIQLGWDGAGVGPVDLISGTIFASTKQLTLGNNSITSVSAVDPITGKALVIPYGIEINGTTWIDPTGLDITRGGAPAKSVQFSAANVVVNPNAQIDIRGGGDLYAYQWVRGNGGSQDILGSASSFAILPSYQADYAPYAPYNPGPVIPGLFGADAGYVNNGLSVGDQIHLDASSVLPAGTYTLLPARYALLPGAFLVTPVAGVPVGDSATLPDGSSLVSGYRFNDLNANRSGQPLTAKFEVAPLTVVKARAQYDEFSANKTLAQDAVSRGLVPPRLPIDAGQLVFAATDTMTLSGKVMADAGEKGRGGLVDISSPEDILIAGSGTPSQTGVLVLDAAELNSFRAESLLIGGVHVTDATGTRVLVQTANVTVDNAGTPLTGPDIILVANNQLTLAPGAVIETAGALAGKADTIILGDANHAGSGNGVVLRVGTDLAAPISRAGVDSSTQPVLSIGAGAKLQGPNVIIDSTGNTTLDPAAILNGTSVSIASGRISLALTDPGNLQSVGGLILSGTALQSLQSGAQALSLLSYSSIDTYGTGQIGQDTFASLALHAAEIRGFNQGDGAVHFVAKNILLDNSASGTAPGSVNPGSGTLAFDADVINLGVNQYRIDQFANLELNAAKGILLQGSGSLMTPGNLAITTPLITGATAADQTIKAGGNLTVASSASASTLSAGLGARLTLVGASVTANSKILLPSGTVRLEATAGDVVIGNTIDVGGVPKTFFDQVRYTDGGRVSLKSDLGSVVLAAGSTVNVSAQAQGGNAGNVAISAPTGSFTLNGTLLGNGGAKGLGGTFRLDVGSLPDPSLASLNAALNVNGFTESRSIRVRNGDVLVDGLAKAHNFAVSADSGTISVTGTIDASGARGGKIDLAASGSVILEQNSRLSVAGEKFDSAGKGGSVSIAAGQAINGSVDGSAVVDIQTGATIDLSVANNPGGTLHLRAPQTADNLDLQINPLNGTIRNASRIIVEGAQIFATSVIDDTVKANVFANGTTFAGNSDAMANRLLANNAGLAAVLAIRPGAEIVNASGDLTLDTSWDLSTYRFGSQVQPGVLTLRAAGNLNFNYNASLNRFASLSDGFDGASYSASLLPAGNESWAYRLVAGADVGAADSLQVQRLDFLNANTGSLLLGNNAQVKGPIPTSNQTAPTIIPSFFQTIRTGTGDIEISAGRDIQLLSPLATIYTAGQQAAPLANFDLPNLAYPTATALGAPQYSTPRIPQYSFGGGNVTLSAQNDIARYQVNFNGTLAADSTKELPTSWLYRRGFIDPATGQFGVTRKGGEVASTSWWVDFSNFFEGVGALGGGNVTLVAGRDVSNVDALIPTNARMPKGIPDASSLVELGGGDLRVTAGHDINGGVFYVERGHGTLQAGNTLHSNPTRAALDQTTIRAFQIQNTVPDPTTWLPTTLFLGKGSFDIAAQGDVLLGPVANPFLLPQGINNSFFQKSYFSTYDPSAAVNVASLTGAITLKDSANPSSDGAAGSLASWYQNVLLFTQNPNSFAAQSQPWLRLAETRITLSAFDTVAALMPATLRATAFSGDLNVVGNMTLSPSPIGTIELVAAGSINGLQPNGFNSATRNYQWGASQINLSDADPNRIPGITSPLSLFNLGPAATVFQERSAWSNPSIDVINGVFGSINSLFNESGSSQGAFGVFQTQLALHAPGPLHAGDLDPVRFYALDGDISGVTLFSGKSTHVVAGQDITDAAFYLQNVAATDVSVVSAGRDIIVYDPTSQLRTTAQIGNNELLIPFGNPAAGDIQISGPGTLEVLAGRNLSLGVGPNAGDGTALGITSIGNARNPNLPFAGADIIAAAGIDRSTLNFTSFIAKFLDPATASDFAPRYLPQLATLLGMNKDSALSQIWTAFQLLPSEQQNRLSLDIFYLVLRDAGRDHNRPTAPGFGNYDAGFAAIASLFPETTAWKGSIDLTSREIKTASGGDISLLAPGGQLLVGVDLSGNQPIDQGILTESGGNISIFTRDNVTVGTSRIFTLRGGNVMIWSSKGDIAAGASSKTVQSAPPTRVLIDPQSGDVKTDLAGLATGGGIGVLTSVAGVAP
ncbi:MAG: filamentous hemagglutinin N-terminal domain-containing protein, partial [Verrucomicrobiota bacterium]